MPPSADLRFALLHSLTKAVVDLEMSALYVLEPDQIRNAVDDRVQIHRVELRLCQTLETPLQIAEIKNDPLFAEGFEPQRIYLLIHLGVKDLLGFGTDG